MVAPWLPFRHGLDQSDGLFRQGFGRRIDDLGILLVVQHGARHAVHLGVVLQEQPLYLFVFHCHTFTLNTLQSVKKLTSERVFLWDFLLKDKYSDIPSPGKILSEISADAPVFLCFCDLLKKRKPLAIALATRLVSNVVKKFVSIGNLY